MIYTSLKEIQSFNPCPAGWETILKGQRKLGNTNPETLFPLTEACESNSISDVCWLIGKRKKELQILVKFARMCADSVSHLKYIDAANTAAAAANIAAADADTNAAAAAAAAADAADANTAAAAAANIAAAAVANANAAANAADAANAAANAAADAAADAAAARTKQKEKNKQFLIQCITEWKGK
jgi:hypothetical protein